ncbi:MAG: DUF167 domain-containing protein [Elusimicrobia bacterium]|nr:DUF167 domain-containing protein [Elusimicrobiota bacterium]
MGTLFRLKAHPGGREDRIVRLSATHYEAWVRAKPQAGKANAAVLGLLAQEIGVSVKRLRIAKGASSPNKIVEVLGT